VIHVIAPYHHHHHQSAPQFTHRYNTEMGVYAPGCGIDNLMFAWVRS
jgi:hypothetical protein